MLRLLTPLAAILAAAAPIGSSVSLAGEPQDLFYKAYYLDTEKNDAAGAAALYEQLLKADGATPELRDQARVRLEACREELASGDFARLMPQETLAYVEVREPGKQLGRLLDMLGLLADPANPQARPSGRYLAISPLLLDGLLGIRGAAVAITGLDAVNEMPIGVGILHAGDVDLIRGLLETGLPVAAVPGRDIRGHRTYVLEGQVHVCLTAKLVIVSLQPGHIDGVLARLSGESTETLATHPRLGPVLETRDNSVVFACVNTKPLMPMILAASKHDHDLAMATTLLDLRSLEWVVVRAGVHDTGVFADVEVRLESGHHNLAYNLVRTPPISPRTLHAIPAGVAAFVAMALSPEGGPGPYRTGDPEVTGLDIGREIFANMIDVSAFALVGTGDTPTPIPSLAAVIRVRDAAQSEALWQQLLGLTSLVAGAPSMEGHATRIDDVEIRSYRFPEGVAVHFATRDDRLYITTTTGAMTTALRAGAAANSVVTDRAFASGLARLTPSTSKTLMIHPGRCLQVAEPFMSPGDLQDVAPFRELLDDLVATATTDEREERFHAAVEISGLPKVERVISRLLVQEQERAERQSRMHHAAASGDWQQALAMIDEQLNTQPRNTELLMSKLETLAQHAQDHVAGRRCAETLLEAAQDDPATLNNVSWALLTEEVYGGQYLDIAERMAKQACRLTDHGNWAFVDTLALARYELGDVREAIRLQEQAIELHGGDNEDLARALTRYRKAIN